MWWLSESDFWCSSLMIVLPAWRRYTQACQDAFALLWRHTHMELPVFSLPPPIAGYCCKLAGHLAAALWLKKKQRTWDISCSMWQTMITSLYRRQMDCDLSLRELAVILQHTDTILPCKHDARYFEYESSVTNFDFSGEGGGGEGDILEVKCIIENKLLYCWNVRGRSLFS